MDDAVQQPLVALVRALATFRGESAPMGYACRIGELPVLPASGAGSGLRSARGGIVSTPGDSNPERVILDSSAMPVVDVGASFPGTVTAVVDYSFGNFRLLPTENLPAVAPSPLERETVTLDVPMANQIDIATFNVENLDPLDPPEKFATLALLIVQNLGAPDLLSLEEVQDNSGPTNDGTVAADVTLSMLIAAIQAAGGPRYEARSIDPLDGADGGESGGNIRVAFLFRTDRGLSFIDRSSANATRATSAVAADGVPQLSLSPGRVDPTNSAFADSRKPLAGEFRFNGHALFVVANHFNSKGGDHPLFGRFQPPALGSEAQRIAQATVVRDFVASINSIDAMAKIVVLGDLNDFLASPPLASLEAAGLTSVVSSLPENEQYSNIFDGNSQVLDHILASNPLFSTLAGVDIVHVNAEFADRASDHDPIVARFTVGLVPSASVVPSRDGVERLGPRSWGAHFGSDNPNALAVTRAIGQSHGVARHRSIAGSPRPSPTAENSAIQRHMLGCVPLRCPTSSTIGSQKHGVPLPSVSAS